MSVSIYRNTTWLQKVRIWRPLAPNWRNRSPKKFQIFFFEFLDELDDFKHFETNLFFSPIWRHWRHKWRQFTKLAKIKELGSARTHPLWWMGPGTSKFQKRVFKIPSFCRIVYSALVRYLKFFFHVLRNFTWSDFPKQICIRHILSFLVFFYTP